MDTRYIVTAAAIASVAQTASALDPFTDFGAWEAAAGPSIMDDFTSYGAVDLNLGENDFFDGYTVTLEGTGTGGAAINGASNFVFTLGEELQSITWTFDEDITGFGADWLNSFVSNGLTVTIDGQSFNVEDSLPAANFEFLGFANGGSFAGATLTVTNAGAGTEFAAISNLYYAPVPSPAGLSALGMVGLLASRRRR